MNTPESITSLEQNQVFVFGSNLAGFHGAGAAALANRSFGAEWGVAEGPTGQCYAIPTKDATVRRTLPIADIAKRVTKFIEYAARSPDLQFLVTKIGCGLAGLKEQQIAPLFANSTTLQNVVLPWSFKQIICAKTASKVMGDWTLQLNTCEAFMAESPANYYRPEPPPGFAAFRSSKRRLFIRHKLNLHEVLDRLDESIASGDAIEAPLVPGTDLIPVSSTPAAARLPVVYGELYGPFTCTGCGGEAWTLWVTRQTRDTKRRIDILTGNDGIARCDQCGPPTT